MKITKEVKTFAEREFNAKVEKARENFYAPITEEKKAIEKEFKVLVSEMNGMLKSFREKYNGVFEININTSYETEGDNLRIGNIAKINSPKFESPDKVRFLAELSMGEDLSDITKLLEKYFD